MARNKTEKITVSFEKPELVRRMVGDIATIENKSLSSIIERIVFENLLPKNNEAKWNVEQFLYSEDGSISKSLSVLFENNAAGINWESVHGNFFPLVQFAHRQESAYGKSLNGNENELHHMYSQTELVIECLDKCAKKVGNKDKQKYYMDQANRGYKLLEELKKQPKGSNLLGFYQLLLDNWDVFKSWTITYRLLSDLVKLGKGWREEPEIKIELLNIIKQVSNEWQE